MKILQTTVALCRMVKIEHSIFALPFAFSGALLGAASADLAWPKASTLFFLTVAMVSVRTFAMTVNRVADLAYDKANPRTQKRPLVTGEVTLTQAYAALFVSAGIFVAASWGMNLFCLQLAPLALGLSAGYSYIKRFSYLCHFGLGAVLGLAPLAGWAGVTGSFAVTPFLLFWAVLFWVAGFDIIYATQDYAFDKEAGLHSFPAHFDLQTALVVSGFSHVIALVMLLMMAALAGLAWPWYPILGIIAGVLWWEHRIISPTDLSRVNAAFFTLNGFIAITFFLGILVAV